jgi:hypothetical protein
MPVRKFRSVAEMPPPPLREPGSEELFRALAGHWRAGSIMADLRFPPGLYRHSSVEELNRQTDAWEIERIERLKLRAARVGHAERAAATGSPPTPDRG